MKKLLLILLVVGGGIYANRGKIVSLYYEAAGRSQPVAALGGLYTQNSPGTLGIRFLGSGRVSLLNGNENIGDPVPYTVSGKNLKITHACGVWNMQIRDGELYHREYKSTFVKR